jgi:hypothetical protein
LVLFDPSFLYRQMNIILHEVKINGHYGFLSMAISMNLSKKDYKTVHFCMVNTAETNVSVYQKKKYLSVVAEAIPYS